MRVTQSEASSLSYNSVKKIQIKAAGIFKTYKQNKVCPNKKKNKICKKG